MKLFKWIGLPLIALVGIYLLLCWLGPATFDTVRSTKIDAPKNVAFNIVNDLNNWEKWSPWMDKDPEIKITYSDQKAGVGSSYTWSGNDQVSSGKMENVEVSKGALIKQKLEFDEFDDPSYAIWKFEEDGESSKVSWTMESEGELPFLMRGMMLVVRAKAGMEKDFDLGLSRIKNMAEERANAKLYGGFKINEVEMGERHFLTQRQEVNVNSISQFYARVLLGMGQKAAQARIETTGMHCGLFYKWNEAKGTADMAAAIPIAKATNNIKGATSITLPAKNALRVDFYGDYSQIGAVHEAIQDYIKDNDLLFDHPIIEQYITDPSQEPDPKKWLTQVTYYLAD